MTNSSWQKVEARFTIAAIVFVVAIIALCIWRVLDKRASDRQIKELEKPALQQGVEKTLGEQQQVITQQGKGREAVSELIHTYNAVTDWEQILKAENPLRPRYSAEVSSALVRPDRRPMLFIVNVIDIALLDGEYQCTFSRDIGLQKLELVLTCSPSMANQVIGGPEDGQYAVIADISSVGSKEEKLGREDGDTSDDLGIGKKFVAKGKCDGLVYVGNGYH